MTDRMTYSAGETFSGHLNVVMNVETDCEAIDCELHGTEHTFTNNTGGGGGRNINRDSFRIIKASVQVHSGGPLQAGQIYRFPFAFDIPSDATGSAHFSDYNRITYHMIATVHCPGFLRHDVQAKRQVRIRSHPTVYALPSSTVCHSNGSPILMLLFEKGHVQMSVDLPPTAAVVQSNGIVQLTVRIHNASSIRLNRIQMHLIRQLQVDVTGRRYVRDSNDLYTQVKCNILPHTTSIQSLEFQLHKQQEPTIIGHSIRCTYAIHIRCQSAHVLCTNAHLNVPITILPLD